MKLVDYEKGMDKKVNYGDYLIINDCLSMIIQVLKDESNSTKFLIVDVVSGNRFVDNDVKGMTRLEIMDNVIPIYYKVVWLEHQDEQQIYDILRKFIIERKRKK